MDDDWRVDGEWGWVKTLPPLPDDPARQQLYVPMWRARAPRWMPDSVYNRLPAWLRRRVAPTLEQYWACINLYH